MPQVIVKLLTNALLQDNCKQSDDLLFLCLRRERMVVGKERMVAGKDGGGALSKSAAL